MTILGLTESFKKCFSIYLDFFKGFRVVGVSLYTHYIHDNVYLFIEYIIYQVSMIPSSGIIFLKSFISQFKHVSSSLNRNVLNSVSLLNEHQKYTISVDMLRKLLPPSFFLMKCYVLSFSIVYFTCRT